jgi:hypothetical protein
VDDGRWSGWGEDEMRETHAGPGRREPVRKNSLFQTMLKAEPGVWYQIGYDAEDGTQYLMKKNQQK